MKDILVSIIVPNFNHSDFLEQRLNTIFNQTFQDFEVILLDDASTDNSIEILNLFKDQPKVSHFLINESNSGSPFKQWQKGIDLAKGEYIWIAESDDYCEATFLERTVGELDKGAGICYAQSADVNSEGKMVSNRIDYTNDFQPNIWDSDFSMEGNRFIQGYLVEKNVIPNASAVLFRKSLVQSSFFTEELLGMHMCGDWFFWTRLCENTSVSFIGDVLNYFRIHTGVTRQHKDLKKKKQRLLEEVVCRNYMMKNNNVSSIQKNKALVEQWCKLHSKWAPLKKNFYRFKLLNFNSIYLLLRFIGVKLKSL